MSVLRDNATPWALRPGNKQKVYDVSGKLVFFATSPELAEYIIRAVNDEAKFSMVIDAMAAQYKDRADAPELQKIAEAVTKARDSELPNPPAGPNNVVEVSSAASAC